MASSLQTYLSAKKMGVGAQASVSHPKRSKSISSLHATAAAPAASDHRHHQKTASASKSHYPLEERQGRGGGGWEEEEHVNNSSRFVYEDDQEIISSATGFFSQKPIKRTYSFHHKHRMVEEPQDEESSSYGGHDSAFASSDSLAANDHKPSGILYSGSRNLNGSSGYMIDGQYVRPHSQDIAREGWIWIHNTTSWKHCYGVATYYNSTPMFQLYADAEVRRDEERIRTVI